MIGLQESGVIVNNPIKSTNTLELTKKTALPTEEPTKLRITLPTPNEVTQKFNLPDESLRDTIDVNRETPDLIPALLLDTEDNPDAWPEPALASPTELPTPPILPSPELTATTDILPMISLSKEHRQENIPTSVIAARPPREQIPTQIIASRAEPPPPKKASILPWVGGLAAVGALFLLTLGSKEPASAPQKTATPRLEAPSKNALKMTESPLPAAPALMPQESKPARVLLEVSSSPEGALVLLDGKQLGPTPLMIELEATSKESQLRVVKEGFITQERAITLTAGVSEAFTLEKRSAPIAKVSAPKTATPKKTPTKKTPTKNDVPNPFK
jgi:hypothetical protein